MSRCGHRRLTVLVPGGHRLAPTEPGGETYAAWADLDKSDAKVIYEQILRESRRLKCVVEGDGFGSGFF